MATTAELIRKEDDVLKKARGLHRARLKKLEETELKRVFKTLKQTGYFEFDFTDQELVEVFENMICVKSGVAPKRANQDNEATSESVIEPDSENESEQDHHSLN